MRTVNSQRASRFRKTLQGTPWGCCTFQLGGGHFQGGARYFGAWDFRFALRCWARKSWKRSDADDGV